MPANYVLTRNLMFLIGTVALTYFFGSWYPKILDEREASFQTRIKEAIYTDCDDPNAEPVEDGAFCACVTGYAGFPCKDIDECELEFPACEEGQTCTNTQGSYECSCRKGEHFEDYKCRDIDECRAEEDPCKHNGKCINREGGYTCECFDGFTQAADNVNCDDVNECQDVNPCGGGICHNSVGCFACECRLGYEFRGGTCADINECEKEKGKLCSGFGSCKNTIGSYYCKCWTGFEANSDQTDCKDVNECNEKHPPECGNGKCVNKVGTWTCECKLGYENRGITPADRSNDDISKATDKKLAIRKLREKFAYCIDINECDREFANECRGNNVYCVNTEGSYNCKCLPGFRHFVDQYKCNDVNECDEYCTPPNGTCVNNPGSFHCTCNYGFHWAADVKQCHDIDECASSPCGKGTCENLIGRYKCSCFSGYQEEMVRDPKDPFARVPRCVDINECLIYCALGKCTNTPGSYKCDCPPSTYFFDRPGHMDCVNPCDYVSCGKGYCRPRLVVHISPRGKLIYEPVWDSAHEQLSYKCHCHAGYTSGDAYFTPCTDIDECTVYRKYSCKYSDGMKCINTKGSYYCECLAGYVDLCKTPFFRDYLLTKYGANCSEYIHPWESKKYPRCQDIDECSTDEQNRCFEYDDYCKCKNVPGTFWCCTEDFNYCYWHSKHSGDCPTDNYRTPPKKAWL